MTTPTLDNLPPEVLLPIGQNLSCQSIGRLSSTCRRLDGIYQDESFWQEKYNRDFQRENILERAGIAEPDILWKDRYIVRFAPTSLAGRMIAAEIQGRETLSNRSPQIGKIVGKVGFIASSAILGGSIIASNLSNVAAFTAAGAVTASAVIASTVFDYRSKIMAFASAIAGVSAAPIVAAGAIIIGMSRRVGEDAATGAIAGAIIAGAIVNKGVGYIATTIGTIASFGLLAAELDLFDANVVNFMIASAYANAVMIVRSGLANRDVSAAALESASIITSVILCAAAQSDGFESVVRGVASILSATCLHIFSLVGVASSIGLSKISSIAMRISGFALQNIFSTNIVKASMGFIGGKAARYRISIEDKMARTRDKIARLIRR